MKIGCWICDSTNIELKDLDKTKLWGGLRHISYLPQKNLE